VPKDKLGAMDADDAIRLRRVITKLARELNPSSTVAGLMPSQASVLGLISSREPVSLGELGELEGLNPTMLSRVISKLHSLGMIDRIPDPPDLRSASVVSTTAGQRVSREVKARRAAAVSRGLEMVPPEQADLLAKAFPALEAFAEPMCEVGLSDRRVSY
jgi:DNA-binding MarR family transcriptional regulator